MRIAIALFAGFSVGLFSTIAAAQNQSTKDATATADTLLKQIKISDLNFSDVAFRKSLTDLLAEIEGKRVANEPQALIESYATTFLSTLDNNKLLEAIPSIREKLRSVAAKSDLIEKAANPADLARRYATSLNEMLVTPGLIGVQPDARKLFMDLAGKIDGMINVRDPAGVIITELELLDAKLANKDTARNKSVIDKLAEMINKIDEFMLSVTRTATTTARANALTAMLQPEKVTLLAARDPAYLKSLFDLSARLDQLQITDAVEGAIVRHAVALASILNLSAYSKGAPESTLDELTALKPLIDKNVPPPKPAPRINIIYAIYGDMFRDKYSPERNCDALLAIRTSCQGLATCTIPPFENLCVGGDPVPHADPKSKWVEIQYQCARAGEDKWTSVASDFIQGKYGVLKGRNIDKNPTYIRKFLPGQNAIQCQAPAGREQ